MRVIYSLIILMICLTSCRERDNTTSSTNSIELSNDTRLHGYHDSVLGKYFKTNDNPTKILAKDIYTALIDTEEVKSLTTQINIETKRAAQVEQENIKTYETVLNTISDLNQQKASLITDLNNFDEGLKAAVRLKIVDIDNSIEDLKSKKNALTVKPEVDDTAINILQEKLKAAQAKAARESLKKVNTLYKLASGDAKYTAEDMKAIGITSLDMIEIIKLRIKMPEKIVQTQHIEEVKNNTSYYKHRRQVVDWLRPCTRDFHEEILPRLFRESETINALNDNEVFLFFKFKLSKDAATGSEKAAYLYDKGQRLRLELPGLNLKNPKLEETQIITNTLKVSLIEVFDRHVDLSEKIGWEITTSPGRVIRSSGVFALQQDGTISDSIIHEDLYYSKVCFVRPSDVSTYKKLFADISDNKKMFN